MSEKQVAPTMKAVFLERKAGAEALVVGEIPRPAPKEGEVLAKIHATAVMPAEFDWFPTFNTPSGQPRPFPIVLSHEFSGVVEALGSGVNHFNAGQAVYGLNDWFTNGAQAEYCVVAATALAAKPKSLGHLQAAVVPISALTAWQGLFEKTLLDHGQTILIHGGAGSVGAFAVQLAHWRGARVIATASSRDIDFVRSLGADEVIDYRLHHFEDAVRDVDVVFDGVGGKTLQRSWAVLKTGGRLVTIASSSATSGDERSRQAFMLVRADGSQLARIAQMIDDARLRVFAAGSLPLSSARQAYERSSQGHLRGKTALTVVD